MSCRRSFLTAAEVLADIEKDSQSQSSFGLPHDESDTENLEDHLPNQLVSCVTDYLESSATSQDAEELIQIAMRLDQEGELQEEALSAQNEKDEESPHPTNPDVWSDLPNPPLSQSQELKLTEIYTVLHTEGDRAVEELSCLRNPDVQSNAPTPSLMEYADCYGSDGSTTNVQDKDYQPSDSSSSDSDVDESQTAEQDDEQQTVVSKTKRKRNKKPDADNWQKNIPKIKRLKGEAHVSRRGKERGKVEMGESGCTSAFCFKSKKRGCSNFTQEDRSNIFNNFWDLPSWSVRQSTVTSLISIGEKKTVKNPNSKRGNPVEYFLKKKDGSKLQVCKEMFCSTLGIHKRTMSDWLSCKTEKSTVGGEVEGEEEEEKQKKPTKKMTDQEILYLKQWLLKVDCVDSHYCRSSESYKNKRFLEPGTKKVDLHERYCNDCKTDGIRPGCLTIFKKYFSDLGLSVFRPRKDQCDLCVGYHHRNVSKEQYDKHIQSKNRARTEKDEDKKLSLSLNDGSMSVWTFDTQSVILCPQTKASALYFRTKLQVHNFTLYNNCTRDGYCYFWDETQGELKAENFASLQFNHYKTFLTTNPNIKTLVLWSDGCLYQNKNSYLSNCYLQLALEQKIDIFQKYLTVGHTQMECDSMHSVIERNMVCDIDTPDDLRIVMQTARRNPSPYTVTPVKFLDFTKMSTTRFNSIRPGRKAGDSVVTQLSHLHYTPEGQIFYKVFHENEEWRSLPVRIANIAPENIKWDPLYTGRQKISKRKYDDLQYMKKVLPQKDHIFYDELEFYE